MKTRKKLDIASLIRTMEQDQSPNKQINKSGTMDLAEWFNKTTKQNQK